MKSKDRLYNYMLSIGFIILVLVFFISLVEISRYVLSDTESFNAHVESTKDLLEDIEKVEKSVELNDEKNLIEVTSLVSIGYNYYENQIEDVSYLNTKRNKSIISLVFNSPMYVYNDIYYIDIENKSEILKDDIILYDLNGFYVGKIFAIEDDVFKVINFETLEDVEISSDKIVGKVILRYNKDD